MSITTRAAVVESSGAPFTLADVELDEPGSREVLVRMVATGLCHTDLGVAGGGLPFPCLVSSATRERESSRPSART